MNIGLFLPNWVGDAVMCTPAARALRTKYQAAHIVGIMRPVVSDVVAGLDLFDAILLHSPHGTDATHRGWRFARSLWQQHFDLAVLFPNSLRSAWWAWISGAKRRVGLAREGRELLLTDVVRDDPRLRKIPHPALRDYGLIAEHLGADTSHCGLELCVTPAEQARFEAFCQRNLAWSSRSAHLVCLNSGGAFGGAKHWPVDSFAHLGRRLAESLGVRVLVLCGPAERDAAREIARQAGHPSVLSLAEEELSLGLTKAAVQSADLLITTDSGPRHFASPFNVPVVTLFGPTHIAWSETNYPRALHLQLDLDCGPCQQRTCPQGHHRCMRELSVEQVFRAACAQWDLSRRGERRSG